MNRILLAEALEQSPANSRFRDLIAASGKYGFTAGHYNSETISLEPRGELLSSRDPDKRLEALRTAFRSIPVFERCLQFYNNGRLPQPDLFAKAVTQPDIGVNKEWASEFVGVFLKTGREVGFIREVSGSAWVLLEAGPPTATDTFAAAPEELDSSRSPQIAVGRGEVDQQVVGDEAPTEAARPLQFFIAHGSNHTPLEQLKRILGEFKIPFLVAQDEPHAGRPISRKVKDLMDACTASIFIFSADEQLTDSDGAKVWRPRENVVYELGAASYLYGQRIVIFKESGVTFPSDFRDLGWIEFEKDRLESKAMDLMKELIGLGALKLVAG